MTKLKFTADDIFKIVAALRDQIKLEILCELSAGSQFT